MSNSAGGEFSKIPVPLITPPALHDIFVLLNPAEAVNVAVTCLTPSGVRVFGEISTSAPDSPFQERVTIAPLGTVQGNITVECRLTFIETGYSENTASFPVVDRVCSTSHESQVTENSSSYLR